MQSAASISEDYIDGWRPWSGQTQSVCRLCKPENVAVSVEEVSKKKINRGDTPMAVVLPSQLERSVKHSLRQMACIKDKTALRVTHNSTANRLVPGALDVSMKKVRPQGLVFDIPRIMPPCVELGDKS